MLSNMGLRWKAHPGCGLTGTSVLVILASFGRRYGYRRTPMNKEELKKALIEIINRLEEKDLRLLWFFTRRYR